MMHVLSERIAEANARGDKPEVERLKDIEGWLHGIALGMEPKTAEDKKQLEEAIRYRDEELDPEVILHGLIPILERVARGEKLVAGVLGNDKDTLYAMEAMLGMLKTEKEKYREMLKDRRFVTPSAIW